MQRKVVTLGKRDQKRGGSGNVQQYRLAILDAVVNAVAHNHIKPPRLTKQGFVAGSAAAVAVASGLSL